MPEEDSRCGKTHGRLDQGCPRLQQTSRADLKLERIDLDRLIGDIVLEYPSLNASGASIEIKSPLGQVLGNETMLTQALSNLMQNSVKFVKPGETPILKIWTEPCDGRVRLCV